MAFDDIWLVITLILLFSYFVENLYIFLNIKWNFFMQFHKHLLFRLYSSKWFSFSHVTSSCSFLLNLHNFRFPNSVIISNFATTDLCRWWTLTSDEKWRFFETLLLQQHTVINFFGSVCVLINCSLTLDDSLVFRALFNRWFFVRIEARTLQRVSFDGNTLTCKVISRNILNYSRGNNFHFLVFRGPKGKHFDIFLKLFVI